jgi:hypothetical protein
MNQLTDPRFLSLSAKLKWGLGVLAVLAFGAVAWLFTLSMISIAIAGTVTMIVVQGAPWMSQKLTHFFLDLRKQDARDNPITNRERISGVNWGKLKERKSQIEAMSAEVVLWENQINALPEDERREFERDLKVAQSEVEKQAIAWKSAEAAQQAFDKLTEKVARKWKVAQTGLRIKALSQQDKEDRINTILANESAESADRALATAFSSLDAIVEQAQANRPALTHEPTNVIDVDSRIIRATSSEPVEQRIMRDGSIQRFHQGKPTN